MFLILPRRIQDKIEFHLIYWNTELPKIQIILCFDNPIKYQMVTFPEIWTILGEIFAKPEVKLGSGN